MQAIFIVAQKGGYKMKNLKKIFYYTEKELYKILPKELIKNGYKNKNLIIQEGSYIYAKGNIPVMLVSHMDTVFFKQPTKIFHDPVYNVLWSPDGLGADDRAGIYSILNITKEFKPYVLFTSAEESGGLGAYDAAEDLSIPKVKYIIELDRQGFNDCVFYDCVNPLFIKYIESFGFIENYGSFSDISALCPIWDIAGVNLSIGYYNQHTKAEYLNLNEMFNTIKKVKVMLSDLPAKKFVYTKARKKSRGKKRYKSLHELTDKEYNDYMIQQLEADSGSYIYRK